MTQGKETYTCHVYIHISHPVNPTVRSNSHELLRNMIKSSLKEMPEHSVCHPVEVTGIFSL